MTDRPPIFADENRTFWVIVRRFLIGIVAMIDRYYNLREKGK